MSVKQENGWIDFAVFGFEIFVEVWQKLKKWENVKKLQGK